MIRSATSRMLVFAPPKFEHTMPKKCILFVVDALAEPIVREWVENGRLPSIATLLARGGNLNPCISIFPSITPAATCSIATGEYPRKHGIEGACWFDPSSNDAAYFGDDLKLAMQEGLHEYLVDFADRLNFERLHTPLIFEHLFESDIESACINYMWFRGPHAHSRTTPWLLKVAAGGLTSDVSGPKYLKLGDFVHGLPEAVGDIAGMQSGVWSHYGFHDETTAACMLAMAQSDSLPRFTLAYFPLNDDKAHEEGIEKAASVCVENFDRFLGKFVDTIGGWDALEEQFSILIVGDHGQVEWVEDGPQIVRLDEVLSDFVMADTAAGFQDDDELLICPNMRAAAIYLKRPNVATRDRVVDELLGHDGVDQVIYEEERDDHVRMLTVCTRDRGRFSFTRAVPGVAELKTTGIDHYGNEWSIHGEVSAVDLKFQPDGTLIEGIYPNVLERIEGAFTGGPSPIWATARPRAEFAISGSSTHQGGSHGALHRDDSVAALLTSCDVDLNVLPNSQNPRIVDVMDLCLRALGASRCDNLLHDTPVHLN